MSRQYADIRHGHDGPIGGVRLSDDEFEGEQTFATDGNSYAPPMAQSYPANTQMYHSSGSGPPPGQETSVLAIPSAPGGLWDESLIRIKGEGVQDAPPPTAQASPMNSHNSLPRPSAHFQPTRPTEPGQLHGGGGGGMDSHSGGLPRHRSSDPPSDHGMRKPGLRNSGHRQPGAFNESNEQLPPATPVPAPAPPPPPPSTPARPPAPAPAPLSVSDDVIVADATLVKPVADVENPSNRENLPRQTDEAKGSVTSNGTNDDQKTLMWFMGMMFMGLVLVLVVVVVVVIMLTRPPSPTETPVPAPTTTGGSGASNIPTTLPPTAPEPEPVQPEIPTAPVDGPTAPVDGPEAGPGPEPAPLPVPGPGLVAATDQPTTVSAIPPTGMPTIEPTLMPSVAPVAPTHLPTIATMAPTAEPTSQPTSAIVFPTRPPSTRNPTPFPTANPTPSPTTSRPTPFPTIASTMFQDTLPAYTQVALSDPGSPQRRALDWLTLQHPRFLTMPEWKRMQLFAMATFYYSYNGADWSESESENWLSTSVVLDECDWGDSGNERNLCNANGRITKLSLEEERTNNVIGTTPPELALLTDLQDLQIFTMTLETDFAGVLPQQLANLTDLSNLRLSFLGVVGTIPTYLVSFQQLTSLNIRSNELNGPIPTELGLMTNMQFLIIRNNFLTGTVPTELANMGSLQSLTLNQNDLTGTIPPGLCSLPSLGTIRMNCEKMVEPTSCGTVNVICDNEEQSDGGAPTTTAPAPAPVLQIPTAFTPFPTSNTQVLDVHGYSLPALRDPNTPQFRAHEWLAAHPDLESMENSRKQQLFALMTFFYSFNGEAWSEFERENYGSYFIPECEWGDSTDPNECNSALEITKLAIEFVDELVGTAMPPELALLSSLQELRIEENPNLVIDLSAMLPSQMAQLPLTVLVYEDNVLTGTLPSQLFEMKSVVNLRLNENLISGSIPTEIASMESLKYLYLFDNPLTGTIPSELGLITSLESISISETFMTGTIPVEVCNLQLDLLAIDCTMIDPGTCTTPEPTCRDSRQTT